MFSPEQKILEENCKEVTILECSMWSPFSRDIANDIKGWVAHSLT